MATRALISTLVICLLFLSACSFQSEEKDTEIPAPTLTIEASLSPRPSDTPTPTAIPTQIPEVTSTPNLPTPAEAVLLSTNTPERTIEPTIVATPTLDATLTSTGIVEIDQYTRFSAERGVVISSSGDFAIYYSNDLLDKPEANILSITIDPILLEESLLKRLDRIWTLSGQRDTDIEIKGLGSSRGEISSSGTIVGNPSRQSYYSVTRDEFNAILTELESGSREYITTNRGSKILRDVAFFEGDRIHIVSYVIGFYEGSFFSNGYPVEAMALHNFFDASHMIVWGVKGTNSLSNFGSDGAVEVFGCDESSLWCNTILPNGVEVIYRTTTSRDNIE